jgi:hypothetical protein
MTFRRLPKPKTHWSDPAFSQDEIDKYEQSLIYKAMQEAGTPRLEDVIIYLMENCHPDAPHKRVGHKKVWSNHLRILIACEFEVEKAKTLELTAERILKKYPPLMQLIKQDPKAKDGVPGLLRQRKAGRDNPLYPSESKMYLSDTELLSRSFTHELQRLKITTE